MSHPPEIYPPDETFTAAEAAVELNRSSKQVRRYFKSGILAGSNASGQWMTTALAIWRYKGFAEEMLENWRRYCLEREERSAEKCGPEISSESNGV